MIPNSSLGVVEALVGAELEVEHVPERRAASPGTATVTVARDCGAGGDAIAFALAKRLGLRCYDRDLLEAVAHEAKVERRLIERLDERASRPVDDWSYSILWGQTAMREDYVRHLKTVVHGIAAGEGGVILGRGVNFILGGAHAFRVRIAGSPARCSERLAAERRIPVEEAAKIVRAKNDERARFIRDTYGRDWSDPAAYDLVLNTDRFGNEQVVRVIAAAMKEAGLTVP